MTANPPEVSAVSNTTSDTVCEIVKTTIEANATISEAITTSNNVLANSIAASNSKLANTLTDLNASLVQTIANSTNDSILAISELSENLSNTLLQTNDGATLKTLAFSAFVVMLGAASAYLFNYFHWKMVSKKKSMSSIGEGLNRLLEDIEPIAIEYWLTGYQRSNKLKFKSAEIKIKGNLKLINRYITLLESKNTVKQPEILKLKNLIANLYDLATGGDFESVKRKTSEQTASRIAFTLAEAKATISEMFYQN